MPQLTARHTKHTKSRPLIAAACVFAGLAGLTATAFLAYRLFLDPYRGTLKKAAETLPLEQIIPASQAVNDIDYAMDMLRSRHPAWLEADNPQVTATEERYAAERNDLAVAGSGVTVLAEWQAISRMMHALGDGHTGIYCRNAAMRYINDFSQLQEYGLPVTINGEPADAVRQRFLHLYQYEMESFANAIFLANILITEAYLKWVGVATADGVNYRFATPSGEQDFHFDFVPIGEVQGYTAGDKNKAPWVSYEIDRERGTGIFTLTSCNYNREYRDTLREFFTAVRDGNIGSIIVDLRQNGGGSSLVADDFLRYLNIDSYYGWPSHIRYGNFLVKNKKPLIRNNRLEPQFSGNLYLLTSSRTFSAAMDFTMLVLDNGLGRVIGEEPGNLPDSYGDTLEFATPHSRLHFTVSFKRWFRIDESKSGQPLQPDCPCEADDALEKAFEIISSKRTAHGGPHD